MITVLLSITMVILCCICFLGYHGIIRGLFGCAINDIALCATTVLLTANAVALIISI